MTIEDKTFANDFLRLSDTSSQKKRKKSCFFKSEKNVKYVFSNTDDAACVWNSLPESVRASPSLQVFPQ